MTADNNVYKEHHKNAYISHIWGLLGIHTKETRIEWDTCTPLFIAALFTIAGTWKQPRCPPTDEWIQKLCYIYTAEYYSAIKKECILIIELKWHTFKGLTFPHTLYILLFNEKWKGVIHTVLSFQNCTHWRRIYLWRNP